MDQAMVRTLRMYLTCGTYRIQEAMERINLLLASGGIGAEDAQELMELAQSKAVPEDAMTEAAFAQWKEMVEGCLMELMEMVAGLYGAGQGDAG